jgi:hypothetical protein
MRVSDLLTLLQRKLVRHWHVTNPGDLQFAAKTGLVELHGFSAIALEEQKRSETDHASSCSALIGTEPRLPAGPARSTQTTFVEIDRRNTAAAF